MGSHVGVSIAGSGHGDSSRGIAIDLHKSRSAIGGSQNLAIVDHFNATRSSLSGSHVGSVVHHFDRSTADQDRSDIAGIRTGHLDVGIGSDVLAWSIKAMRYEEN